MTALQKQMKKRQLDIKGIDEMRRAAGSTLGKVLPGEDWENKNVKQQTALEEGEYGFTY